GLQVTLLWTWAIAYRRFHQGLLIRYGRSYHVSIGTVVRLIVMTATVITAALLGAPGIMAAGLAITTGVIAEAIYAGVTTHPVVTGPLSRETPVRPPLDWPTFRAFYVPLALTSL